MVASQLNAAHQVSNIGLLQSNKYCSKKSRGPSCFAHFRFECSNMNCPYFCRNRNFRLYLSSKLGKNNPLVLAARCRFYMHRERPSKKQIFLDSLVVPAMKNSSENVFHISMDENCTETGTTNILKVSAQGVFWVK